MSFYDVVKSSPLLLSTSCIISINF